MIERRLSGDVGYVPRRRDWDLDALCSLSGDDPLAPRSCSLPNGARERAWADLVAEYDARRLERELHRRGGYSRAFHAFLAAWVYDEAKHTRALHWLYSRAFDVAPEELDERLEARLAQTEAEFDGLESFLRDEFRLAVVLAYDEAMSTHGYGADIPFYASLARSPKEERAFRAILRELRTDEAVHYRNAVALIAHEHPSRRDEIDATVHDIVSFDCAQEGYGGGFLLDHASDQFDADAMERIGASVARAIHRAVARVHDRA